MHGGGTLTMKTGSSLESIERAAPNKCKHGAPFGDMAQLKLWNETFHNYLTSHEKE